MSIKTGKWDIENLQKMDRKSKEWVRFVQCQELRIKTQLDKYNNLETIALQFKEEEVEMTLKHESKIAIVILILNQTIDRIIEGKYGKCIICDQDIPATRLYLIPSVTKCINCENNLSHTNK
jgi:RNA polymerase-binding transcription factor DksA